MIYTGLSSDESQYKNQEIAFLCNEYINKFYSKKKLPLIYLELEDIGEELYKVGFDLFEGARWKNAEENRPYKGKGIRISIISRKNKSESVLKLLDYAITNLKQLKQIDDSIAIMDHYEKPCYSSLSDLRISQILSKPTTLHIKEILKVKVYRKLVSKSYQYDQTYYLENDKFNFYLDDKVYLTLENVQQIITVYGLGQLIFNTDSTFYFFDIKKGELSKMFNIERSGEYARYYKLLDLDTRLRRFEFEYS